MRYRSILLFGAPGSGKGTQGKIIGNIPGFHHSSTGDIFRSLDLQSPMGRKFWEFAGKGELVPDEFTISLWKQYIKGMEMVNQFHPETEFLVLDGIPRNLGQARLLEETLEVVQIIYLRADLNKMVERLRRRALKENRIDDASDVVIKRRLEVYERETRPVLDFYPPALRAKSGIFLPAPNASPATTSGVTTPWRSNLPNSILIAISAKPTTTRSAPSNTSAC
jgi:adenylate kinase